jgi:epsilon-lactone hydrolase
MNLRQHLVKGLLTAMKTQKNRLKADDFENVRRLFDLACAQLKPQLSSRQRAFKIGTIDCEWQRPKVSDNERIVLYVHGGGYAIGSIVSHRGLASRLAHECGCAALLFNYRLAPENPYPAAIHDVAEVYQWLLDNDYEPEKIAICGDSAGGGLVLASLLYLRDQKLPLPACTVLLSPWADLTGAQTSHRENILLDPLIDPDSTALWGELYANGTPLDTPYISPIFGDFAGLPPMLIHVGTEEMLLDDSKRVLEIAQKANIEAELKIWDGMIHVFQQFWQILPEAKTALKEIGVFVQQKTTRIDKFQKKKGEFDPKDKIMKDFLNV